MVEQKISICCNIKDFFNELLNNAILHQNVVLSENTKKYITELLSNNMNPENLIKKNDNNPYPETPLAILFQQATMEEASTKIKMFKFIGDYSLYIGGYFSESLNRKIIDVDYYISMGSNAYNNLSGLSASGDNKEIFAELYDKFLKVVELITEISFTTNSSTSNDLIRLYDRWLKTGNTILEQKLNERGIVTSEKTLKVA